VIDARAKQKTIIKYYYNIYAISAQPLGDVKTPRKKTPTLTYISYILALIGGIIISLFGLFDLLEVGVRVFRDISLLSFLGGTTRALFEIVVGIVCAIGSKFVRNLVWAIVLLVLGLVAGTIGGTLVVIGAILGIASILLKAAPK
jgi:hypothetical protein